MVPVSPMVKRLRYNALVSRVALLSEGEAIGGGGGWQPVNDMADRRQMPIARARCSFNIMMMDC